MQADKRESPLCDTFLGVESPPVVRFEPLLATGNQIGRRRVHGANKRPGEVDTSVSDFPRGMCSRQQATTWPERYSTCAFANDCGNCCRSVERTLRRAFWAPDRRLLIFMRHWHRLAKGGIRGTGLTPRGIRVLVERLRQSNPGFACTTSRY